MAARSVSGFDVITEPWIPVVPLDGSPLREVSIQEVVTRGRAYRRIAGESPTMTAALHRLVLAILHRAYQGPEDLDSWAGMWNANPGLPVEPLENYHQRFLRRFDLLDEKWPFLQCPALRGGRRTSTAALVAYRSTGQHRTLFDHTTSRDSPRLSLAEAARWLVTIQLYDSGGTKADPKTAASPTEKANADKKASRAPHGILFGCVLVEGATLHETLLLNTLLYDPAFGKPHTTSTDKDMPVWEAAEPLGLEQVSRDAHGWTDLLTWQSRRVLLFPEVQPDQSEAQIASVLVAPGARLKPVDKSGSELKGDELLGIEHMAAFVASVRSPRGRPSVMRPNALKGAWRHGRDLIFSSEPWWTAKNWRTDLRQTDSEAGSIKSDPARRRPLALDLIAGAAEARIIAPDAVYTLRIVGQSLEASATKPGAWMEESIPLPVSLLRVRNPALGNAVGRALELAASLGEELRALERSYRKACQPERKPGSKSKDPADVAPSAIEIAYWPRVAAPFARLLHELGGHAEDGDWARCRGAIEEWGAEQTRLADRTAQAWISGNIRRSRTLDSLARAANAYERQRRVHLQRFTLFCAQLDADLLIDSERTGQDDH